MNGHPSLEQLRSYLHGDIEHAERDVLGAHVRACTACGAELSWVWQTSAALLALPLHSAPDVWPRIESHLQKREPDTGPTLLLHRPARRRSALLRAAVITLVAAAGAAAATIPGSPVRAWLASLIYSGSNAPAETRGVPSPPDVAPAVFVLPVTDNLVTISVEEYDPALRIRVVAGAAAELEVRATGAAAGAAFSTRRDHIGIRGAGAGEVVLRLPQQSGNVQVALGHRVVLRKQGGSLQVLAPYADTIGTEIVIPATPDTSR